MGTATNVVRPVFLFTAFIHVVDTKTFPKDGDLSINARVVVIAKELKISS